MAYTTTVDPFLFPANSLSEYGITLESQWFKYIILMWTLLASISPCELIKNKDLFTSAKKGLALSTL